MLSGMKDTELSAGGVSFEELKTWRLRPRIHASHTH